MSLVPASISNRYQWKPKAPVEKLDVLSRGHWSRLRVTGWETGAFGPSQPVPKAHFLVVGPITRIFVGDWLYKIKDMTLLVLKREKLRQPLS